jgi:hypothetical protein
MRHALHIVVSILLWILFGYYWYVVVAHREVSADTLHAMGVLVGSTALGLALTLWWIAHNKRIASRGRRKGTLPASPEPFDQDYLGRPLDAPAIEELRLAPVVDVLLDDEGRKVYRNVHEPGGEGT